MSDDGDDLSRFVDLIPRLEELLGKKVPVLIRGMRVIEYMDEDGGIGTWYESAGDGSKRGMVAMLEIAKFLVSGVAFEDEDA